MPKGCDVEGCERKYYGKGLCEMHYQRLRLTGTTDPGKKAHAPLIERLMRKTKRQGDCIVWTGFVQKTGYGMIQTGGKGSPTTLIHRVAYEAANGPIPSGMVVMHSCDVRHCVNPDHLSVGTHSDNTQDMLVKRREGMSRLTPEQVIEIRASSEGTRALSRKYGVAETTIYHARTGVSWKHLEQSNNG